MNAATATPTAAHDLRSPALFQLIVTISLVAAVLAAVWSPPGWLSFSVAIVVIALLGIPHGAVDHLVVEAIDGRRPGSRRRFVARYVLAMAGVGLVWLTIPGVALAAFLVASVHHFGQSDLAYLRLAVRPQLVLQWSRGLLIVGLPIVAHLTTVAPVIRRLGGGDPSTWPWLAEWWWLWCAILVGQHVVVSAAITPRSGDRAVVVQETVTVATLTLVLLLADPLIGFAVYFGLWHSLSHLLALAELLGTGPSREHSLVRLTAPLSVVSIVGFALVAGAAAVAGYIDLVLPLAVVFVAMLTAPHMVVVERLWRH